MDAPPLRLPPDPAAAAGHPIPGLRECLACLGVLDGVAAQQPRVYDRLGEPLEARMYLDRVLTEHAETPAARLAASYLDRLEG